MRNVSGIAVWDARRLIIEKVSQGSASSATSILLQDAFHRVLAESAFADRDYPPLARSVRDGFAVRAQDLPGQLEIIGEVRAGECSPLTVGPGQAIEIMTGAPVPAGADAIVMVEHVERDGTRVSTTRTQKPGDFINSAGSEARKGDLVIANGSVLNFARIAMLSTIGKSSVQVYTKPRVSVLSTGDEVVPVEESPLPFQVRNSNMWSLSVQVAAAGGEPIRLPVAKDVYADTRALIEAGLQEDLLLLSGGVSAGKYDLVEQVLADLGAEFYFTRVLIQPGQPLVFGRCQQKFFFGLPGNPASTMVCFELFARAAVELLAGQQEPQLNIAYAKLTENFKHKTGLTRFLPARLSSEGRYLTPIHWQGSSDVHALSKANAFLIAEPDRESWQAGEYIGVLIP